MRNDFVHQATGAMYLMVLSFHILKEIKLSWKYTWCDELYFTIGKMSSVYCWYVIISSMYAGDELAEHYNMTVLIWAGNDTNDSLFHGTGLIRLHTVYPNKYAHGFVVLCFVVVMQSFIMNSHEVFIHIHQGCFAGTGAIVRLPQCQWSKPDGYGKISQWITTTKHSKAKTVCIFLGIYCTYAQLQVTSCVRKASAFYHTLHGNHWHRLREIRPIDIKSNNIASDKCRKFIVNMFDCFTAFKHGAIKGAR